MNQLYEGMETLEAKEKLKMHLLDLIEISKDPYYDQYLNQMLRDLESGKATPAQVAREADRTYKLYQQRMGMADEHSKQAEAPAKAKTEPTTVEFKIGAGIFSIIGAVFVLAAFTILGFNFLEGIWQGLCLYAAALLIILISEILIKRLSRRFSIIVTGIGIGSLYIATVTNYLVLKAIGGIGAILITAVIALLSILLGRKKDAASIRVISFLGCYISFLPIKGFESELSFFIMTGMFLLINLTSIFLPNSRNRKVINAVHMAANTLFTGIVTGMILADGMDIKYSAFFVIASLVVLNTIYLREKENVRIGSTIIFAIAIGFSTIFLACMGCFSHGETNEKLLLFNRLMTETMAIVTAAVFFILWGKEKYKWIQYYFIAAVVVLFNGFSEYNLEITIGILAIFILTKVLCSLYAVKELTVLDCILAVITAFTGLTMPGEWPIWAFALVLLLSVALLRKMVIFHEIVITLFFAMGILLQFDSNWTLPGCTAMLLLLFLLFNHLPILKEQKQLVYNIVNIGIAGLFYLCVWACDDYVIASVTMLIGSVAILVMFRKRYGLGMPRKYLLLAGFLTYMILVAGFETPVVVSILLMTVAVCCVGIGFKLKDKVYRICGLVMAVFVCLKLVLYDFRGIPSLSKVILFLVVGLIALSISFLYIYLEKKEDDEKKEDNEKEEVETSFSIEETPGETETAAEMAAETEASEEPRRDDAENAEIEERQEEAVIYEEAQTDSEMENKKEGTMEG